MEYKRLKSEAQAITMPEEMKRRIVRNCMAQMEGKERFMRKNQNTALFRKPAAAVAALVVCLSLSVTALASTGRLQGFFRDITDYRGAVVGTSYEHATDEIAVNATVTGEELAVTARFSDPERLPYSDMERLGIAEYKILDENGGVVKEGAVESAEIADGGATVRMDLTGIDSGRYRLVISAFVSEKKADQPMTVSGHWEAEFEK